MANTNAAVPAYFHICSPNGAGEYVSHKVKGWLVDQQDVILEMFSFIPLLRPGADVHTIHF